MKKAPPFYLLFLIIIFISLPSCSASTSLQNPALTQKQKPLTKTEVDRTKVVMGQKVYVPIYSHIYHQNSQDNVMDLSATLSIRNTDLKNSLIITAVDYYDTEGTLIRQDVNSPVLLKPLASTSFFVAANDVRGGAGANFIVEWVSEKVVSEPLIEAVMIGTSSGQGISFISPGKVIQSNQ